MNNHNCLFQVSLIHNGTLLVQFDWSDDAAAVCEAMDEINHRSSRDLIVYVNEHDHRRGTLMVSKNGYQLLITEPFELKPINDKIIQAVQLIMRCDKSLKASVVTRGSGQVNLPEGVTIKG